MNERIRIVLSSLVISLSAAAMLGLPGIAAGDPPETPYCWAGTPCSLGYNSHGGAWIYTNPWPPHVIEGVDYPNGEMIWEDPGTCGFDESSPPNCACQGWSGGGWNWVQLWFGDPGNPSSWYYEFWPVDQPPTWRSTFSSVCYHY